MHKDHLHFHFIYSLIPWISCYARYERWIKKSNETETWYLLRWDLMLRKKKKEDGSGKKGINCSRIMNERKKDEKKLQTMFLSYWILKVNLLSLFRISAFFFHRYGREENCFWTKIFARIYFGSWEFTFLAVMNLIQSMNILLKWNLLNLWFSFFEGGLVDFVLYNQFTLQSTITFCFENFFPAIFFVFSICAEQTESNKWEKKSFTITIWASKRQQMEFVFKKEFVSLWNNIPFAHSLLCFYIIYSVRFSCDTKRKKGE